MAENGRTNGQDFSKWAASMGIEMDEACQRLEKRLQPLASAD